MTHDDHDDAFSTIRGLMLGALLTLPFWALVFLGFASRA